MFGDLSVCELPDCELFAWLPGVVLGGRGSLEVRTEPAGTKQVMSSGVAEGVRCAGGIGGGCTQGGPRVPRGPGGRRRDQRHRGGGAARREPQLQRGGELGVVVSGWHPAREQRRRRGRVNHPGSRQGVRAYRPASNHPAGFLPVTRDRRRRGQLFPGRLDTSDQNRPVGFLELVLARSDEMRNPGTVNVLDNLFVDCPVPTFISYVSLFTSSCPEYIYG